MPGRGGSETRRIADGVSVFHHKDCRIPCILPGEQRSCSERRVRKQTEISQGSLSFVARIKEIVPENPICTHTLCAPENADCANLRRISLGALFGFIDNTSARHPSWESRNRPRTHSVRRALVPALRQGRSLPLVLRLGRAVPEDQVSLSTQALESCFSAEPESIRIWFARKGSSPAQSFGKTGRLVALDGALHHHNFHLPALDRSSP